MTQPTLFVCALCRFSATEREQNGVSGGQYLLEQLTQALADQNLADQVQLQPVRCMAACSRSCVAALAAPEKLTFVFNELVPDQSADELLKFIQQYLASTTGNVPYRERPALIRSKLMAVLPAVPVKVPS
jgi:predicted metal-binding protein